MHKKKPKLPSKNIIMIVLSVGLIYVLCRYRKLGYADTFWIKATFVAYIITVASWLILTFLNGDDDN